MLDGQQIARVIKDRRLFVLDDDFSLEPDTLVGSWFLMVQDSEIAWRGIVVAEPQAGQYVCHLDKLAEGSSNVQRVFSLDTLMGLGDEGRRNIEGSYGNATAPVVQPAMEFRLYDSEAEANRAFAEWATRSIHKEA
jgi:hypothetical protein